MNELKKKTREHKANSTVEHRNQRFKNITKDQSEENILTQNLNDNLQNKTKSRGS